MKIKEAKGMAEKNGVIYIFTNPSFPEYVKIGYADDIDERLKQLNRSECTPFAVEFMQHIRFSQGCLI